MRGLLGAVLVVLAACDCGGRDGDGERRDAGRDGGPRDAFVEDAPSEDGGPTDAGPDDGGPLDAGAPDAGPPDAGPPDAGPPDAGPPDAGPPDAGPPDAGPCMPIPWTRETAIATGDVNLAGSMALGPDGAVHASAGLESMGGLVYVRRAPGGGWAREPTGSPGSPNYSALALDAGGGVHIAYRDTASATLSLGYAYRAPDGTWRSSIIDGTGNPSEPSITIAADGLHVSYQGGTGPGGTGALWHAFRPLAGGAWTRTEVERGILASGTSIAVDATGTIHVSYTDQFTRAARYASRAPAGGWMVEPIRAGHTGGPRSLFVDAAGVAHVSLGTAEGLRYARRGPTGWAFELADPTPERGYQSSIAVDALGRVHVSYKGNTGAGVWYAQRSATTGAWGSMAIDATAYYLGPTSLAVDATGLVQFIYMTYVPASGTNLLYARMRECP